MFDIGFSELILVFIIGLVVLGPQRLPVAVKTVVGWIRALRSLAANVQNELAQELKLQELQDSLKKVEEASKNSLSPELKASMEELKQSAESMKRTYLGENEKADDEANTIHNPLVKNAEDSHEGVTPAAADHQASAPAQAPEAATSAAPQPAVQQEQHTPVVHVSPAASDMAAAHSATVRVAEPAASGVAQVAETVSPVASDAAVAPSAAVHVAEPAASGVAQVAEPASSAASNAAVAKSATARAAEAPAAASAPYETAAGKPDAASNTAPAAAPEKPKAVKDEAPTLSSRAPVSTTQPDER